MEAALSLSWIAVVAVVSPLLAGLVPRRLLPEAVLLLTFGVLIGPHALGTPTRGEAVDAFRELGLAMLFLLAGYEIELRELTGRGGLRALRPECAASCWLVLPMTATLLEPARRAKTGSQRMRRTREPATPARVAAGPT